MKRLADLSGDEKREVSVKIVPYLVALLASKAIQEAQTKRQDLYSFATVLLKECRGPLVGLLAAMNQIPMEQYKPAAPAFMADLMELLQDPDILALLGLKKTGKVYATYHAEDGSTQNIIYQGPIK